MAKLNQIIAVEKGIKSASYAAVSDAHKLIQKPELFNGMRRVYQPLDDQGERLPEEGKRVQYLVPDTLKLVEQRLSELMNIVARKDWANCAAFADITVDDNIIAHDVPVTYLLFLEKQLIDMQTFIAALPVLDDGESWTFDPNSGMYRSAEVKTHRTQKIAEPIVLYPATPEHPAQTQLITKDVLAGHWSQTKFSGAMPKPEKNGMLARVAKLLQAVKMAREAANGRDETGEQPDMAKLLFDYVVRDTLAR